MPSWRGALVGVIVGSAGEVPAPAAVLAFASAGFLCWNLPPAKVFLGDVGSGCLGYVIAVFAFAARTDPTALRVWLILGGVFFVDATVTLVRRWLRGERVFEAHRSHAHQWLARRWNSHGKVTMGVVGINLVWLVPWSVLAEKFPEYAILTVIAALVPLAMPALVTGSGRAERARQDQ
jgi:Fuc2NAc and GlcNAc transferase